MRERLTWKRGGATNAPARRASAHPAYPDEGAANPAYQPDPEADAYENGDPSSWAEDPHPGPYPQSAHPAYPDEGPASPAYIAKQGSVAFALERKAAKCVRLASAMLGPNASQHEVENQALAFMDMSERALRASLSRLAAQDEGDESDEHEQEEKEKAKKAAYLRRRAQQEKKDEGEDEGTEEEQQEVKGGKKAALAKAAYLRRLAQQIEEEVEEDEGEDEDEGEEEEQQEVKGGKKASALDARLARIERLLTAGLPMSYMQEEAMSPEEAMLEAMLNEEQGAEHEAQSLEEMLLEEMQHEAQQQAVAEPFGMMAQQLAMQGDASGPQIGKPAMQGMKAQQHMSPEAQQAEAQLAEMLQEEGMGGVLGAEYQDAAEAMLIDPSGDNYVDPVSGMVVDPSGDDYDDGMMSDPMGLMDGGMGDDDALLASLFGDESMKYAKQAPADAEEQEEEPKKAQQKSASLRPQPKKATTGATRLGGITKEAAEVSDLSKLWESAPDVSKYF